MTKVKLVSYSQQPEGHGKLHEFIAYCARVSNPSNQNNKKTSGYLRRYHRKKIIFGFSELL